MKRCSFLALALAFLLPALASAEVRLPAILSDHMVVQAEAEVPIWGWAAVGEEVTVTLGAATASTKGDAAGKWQVRLRDLKANAEPQVLTVKGSGNTITVQDVLVGEVWLGSGQSNMGMMVSGSKDYAAEQQAANHPTLRMFTVERNAIPEMQDDCKGSWAVCSAETVGRFSAALYFFGRDVQKELKVPMGLINSSWGGTAIEAWTSLEAQAKLPDYREIAEPWEEAMAKPFDAAKAEADYAAAMVAWREAAKVAKEAGKEAPRAPKKAVDARLSQNRPANLFNGMIHPIIPYAFRGAVWYQGEANSARSYAGMYGLQLQTLIEDWRTRWGHEFPFAWVQLPDYRAPQKAPVEMTRWPVIREQMLQTLKVLKTGMAIALGLGEERNIHPKNKQEVGRRLSLWALGKVYGNPVAATSGPLPTGHEVKGSTMEVTFDHAEGGLKAKDGGEALKGFAIAGEDRRFVWAEARVEGNKVLVSSPEVVKPVAVRYAWSDNPVWSLTNSAGLPATPFRTDDWKIDLKVAAIFSDHAVVQNGLVVPVWGWAEPGDEITVTLADQTGKARATSDGTWQVRLGRLKTTAEPQKLVIQGRGKTITVNDVLVGEVWLASGQSNMEFPFSRGAYPEAESQAAKVPLLRLFKVAKQVSRTPQAECTGEWLVSTPESVQAFSAVAYFFGKDLQETLQSPVGMIDASWGGTDIAAWTSEEAQVPVPALKKQLDAWARNAAAYDPVVAQQNYDKAIPIWKEAVKKAKAEGKPKMPPKPQFQKELVLEPNYPANLFNGMIAPIIPYSIRGAIWYQGEHNCSTAEKAALYGTQLPLLIQDWRARWRYDFPFAWVQLPGYKISPFRPQVREAMLKSLSVKNTGMAVTVDIGEENDNHPKNKKDVGRRLSLWAQARVYRKEVKAFSGPLPSGHEVKGASVALSFSQIQGGLVARGDEVTGFEIAGEDKQWKPAEAKIVGGRQVVVSSAAVEKPVAVRYGWAPNPDGNLFNGAGLPASPFRTEPWD